MTGDVKVETWWTRFLVAYWILVSSVILLNLFIALMSDTFQRVYDNAVGVAALEKAEIIAELEGKLNKKSRDRYLKDLEDNYSPLCEFAVQLVQLVYLFFLLFSELLFEFLI